MKRLLFLIATLFTLAGHSQILPTQHGWQKVNVVPAGTISTPKFAFTEVYKNTMSVSWTVPTGATNTIVQYSTDKNFSTTSTVYSGASSVGNGQLVDLTGLTENTRYYFRVKSTGVAGAESSWVTDSIKTFWTPPGNYRIATSADLTISPFINVGDYIIDGWNSYGEHEDVWGHGIGGFYGLQVPKLAAGKKVCILGGRGYDYITLDMSLNQGTASNPVVVTNIGGQVKGRLNLANCRNVKITGKYDPVAKTGDAEFQGFDKTDWSKLNGSFGFFVKGQWTHPEVILSHVHGDTDSTTIEYIETGEGGYSGMTVKNDNGTVPMRGMKIQFCYTHDTGGEAYYIGSTQNPPQMPVVDFEIQNNVIARAGLNGIQVGNMKGNNYIHNNVVMQSAYEWNNSFQKFQDQAIQLSSRQNGLTYTNNIACGTAGDFLNWFMIPEVVDTPSISQTTNVNNNLFLDSRSHGGGYVQTRGSTSIGSIISNNNTYGNFGNNNGYNVIFTTEATHDYVLGLESINSGQMAFSATGNQFDQTFAAGTVLARKNPTNTSLITVTQSSNTQVSSVARPAFSNYADGMFDTDYSAGEHWVNAQCTEWNLYNRAGTAFSNIVTANNTTSTTTLNIPTVHPTNVSLFIGTGKTDYKAGYRAIVTSGSNSFTGTILSYDPSTGQLFLSSISNTGTGTYSNWNVSLDIESIVIARNYGLNEVVRSNGRFFKSLHANNIGNQPTGNTDSHWQLIVFSNGSTKPPDDVRLPSTDVYAIQGMGLTQTAPTSFITELRNNNLYTNNKYTLR
jgi:hypothetical protein